METCVFNPSRGVDLSKGSLDCACGKLRVRLSTEVTSNCKERVFSRVARVEWSFFQGVTRAEWVGEDRFRSRRGGRADDDVADGCPRVLTVEF